MLLEIAREHRRGVRGATEEKEEFDQLKRLYCHEGLIAFSILPPIAKRVGKANTTRAKEWYGSTEVEGCNGSWTVGSTNGKTLKRHVG